MNDLKHQIVTVVSNYFQVLPEKRVEAMQLLGVAVDNVFISLGACELCYGKGYIIESLSKDFHEEGEPHSMNVNFCECKRGQQLKGAICYLTP